MRLFLSIFLHHLFVSGETLLGKFLVFCAWASVIGVGIYAYASAWSEYSSYFYILGIHKFNQILHNLVDAVFMEVSVIAEAEKIELERLALDHAHIRDVGYSDFSEIGLTRDGAERSELWTVETHPIVVFLMFVHEGFQHLWTIIALVFCFAAQ